MNEEIKIELGSVQETLLLPLWARAKEAEKENPIVRDNYARDIIARIDYDFSRIESGQVAGHQIVWPIRAYNFDRIVREFMADSGEALVINIGAGLDTTFQRVDDGDVLWVNIDLPDVVSLRRRLIPDSERETTVARSIFDFAWIEDIARHTERRSILFMAAGVLYYFEAEELRILFRKLAGTYPAAHVIFDSMSWFAAWGTNREIMRDSGMDSSAVIRWHMKNATDLKKWVDTVKVIEEYPMLSNLPDVSGLSRRVIWGLRIVGLFRLYNMVHVQL